MKKALSLILSLALVFSLCTGLSVTAAAEEAALTVYTQVGENEAVLAKSYTASELDALKDTKADGYGYVYYKGGAQAVVATEFVTVDALLADAGVSFAAGDKLTFGCEDGPYTKGDFTYEMLDSSKYFFENAEVPAAVALTWNNGALADGTVADIAATAKNTGNLRFVCGATQEELASESAAGKRMPSGVIAITVVSPCPSDKFSDVPADAWYHSELDYAVANGHIYGTSSTTFSPNGTVTYAQVATILARISGNAFVSLDDGFAWAVANNLTAETDGGKAIPRQEIVKMLYAYAKLNGADMTLGDDTNILSYVDVFELAEDAIPAMQWACGAGLVHGTDKGELLPVKSTTRCQFVTLLYRLCEDVL